MTRFLCLFLFLSGACSSRADDPTRALTRAECEAAVAHAIALIDADPAARPYADTMRLHRAARVDECLATATLADHRCLMNARTFTELGLCPMPGRRGDAP